MQVVGPSLAFLWLQVGRDGQVRKRSGCSWGALQPIDSTIPVFRLACIDLIQMAFLNNNPLHTGEVVGSIPTAPTSLSD